MTPVYIRTVEDLDAVVKIGVTKENLVLEFKGEIDWDSKKKGYDHKRKATAQQETCRDIAQFANTSGGSLLIGVKERLDPANGLKLAIGFESVNKPDGMNAWIEEAIKNYLGCDFCPLNRSTPRRQAYSSGCKRAAEYPFGSTVAFGAEESV